MADITIRTQDVSIRGNVSGNFGEVNANNEQLTHDATTHSLLGQVEQKIATSWQFFAENDKAFVSDYAATLGVPVAEKDFMLLYNPAASGIWVRIKAVAFSISTSSTTAIFNFYKDPTVTTAGTLLNIENFKTNGVTGDALTYHTPTIAARGEIFKSFALNSGGVGISRLDEDLSLYILEGEYFLITIDPSSVNKAFVANLSWAEETIPV